MLERIKYCVPLLFSALAIICVSCDRRYTEIESYLQERPDSAWTVLHNHRKPWPIFPESRARYELLAAWSQDEMHLDDGSLMHEMEHAAAWYEKHGSSWYWMLSQYYLGDQRYDSGEDHAAMVSFASARDLANARADHLYAGRAEMKIGDILRRNSCEDALAHYAHAAKRLELAGKMDEAGAARRMATIPVEVVGVCPQRLLNARYRHIISPEECNARSEEALAKKNIRRLIYFSAATILLLVCILVIVLFKKKNQQVLMANLAAQTAQNKLEEYLNDHTPATRALAERFEQVCKVQSEKSEEQVESILYELRHDKLFHKELLSEVFRQKPDTRVKYQNIFPDLKEEEQILLLCVLAGMPHPVLARIFGTTLKSMHKRIERLTKKIDTNHLVTN